MSNLNVSIELSALGKMFATKSGKRAIAIPIDEFIGIVETQKGKVFLNLTAIESDRLKFEQSHILKPNLSKECYNALSEEQRREIPIVGHCKPAKFENSTRTEDLPSIDELDF